MAIGSKKFLTILGSIATGGWFRKMLVYGFELFLLQEVIEVLSTITNAIWGGTLLLWADNNPDLAEKAVNKIATKVTEQTPIAVSLAALTMNQITGLSIDAARLKTAASATDRQAYKQVMGDEFTQVVSQMLDVKLAQQDFQTRSGFAGSFANLSSYFGTNLDFQLRSLTIGTISSITGWQSLRHLEGLHQSINWAFGFGWLSWSVLSNAMDVTVNAGMKRYYLSLVRPHDLTLSQANKLRIRNVISPDIWEQVHANSGMRNDARDWALELEFNQPSMAVVQKAYEHKLATPAQVEEQMLLHELTPNGAEWQKQEILNSRKWALEKDVAADFLRRYKNSWTTPDAAKTYLAQIGYTADEIALAVEANTPERIYHLREAVTKEHLKFLRQGWETETDTRNWLNSQGWTEEEIQLAIEANRLERKAAKVAKPHQLNQTQLKLAMKYQLMSADDVYAYLLNQGYDEIDALIIVIEDEIQNLPTLKDCGDPFSPKQLLGAIAGVTKLATGTTTPASLLKWAECAITKL